MTVHVLVAAGFVLLHFSAPEPSAAPWRSQAVLIAPALPRPTPLKPPKLAAIKAAAPINETSAPPARVEARAFRAPVVEQTQAPVVRAVEVAPLAIAPPPVASPIAAALPSAASHLPVLPAPPMKTDSLSSAAAAPIAATNGKLESAGFGTSGIAARAAPANGVQASVGAFGASSVSARTAADAPRISQGAFGNASATAYRASSDAQRAAADTAIEILEKPKPKYTDEATRLRIEGEVLVEAVFPASGAPRVLRVIRGLGHGLDENAEAAAQAIRFRPATRAGHPVDSTAVVHIVFQIAF